MAELSVRYAVALFDLSMEKGLLNEYLEQTAFLLDLVKTTDFTKILEHPDISEAEKGNFLNKSFAGKLYDDLLGFLHLIVAKDREKFLTPAINEFISMGERYNRKVKAEVISADELNESQIAELKKVLSKKLNKHVDIETKVDPSVIGGLYINADGYIIDRTVKKQLKDMKDTIKRGTPNDFRA